MRVLLDTDFEELSEFSKARFIKAAKSIDGGAKHPATRFMSDYSGNIFYEWAGVTKPLNICIPELKNEPKFGGE